MKDSPRLLILLHCPKCDYPHLKVISNIQMLYCELSQIYLSPSNDENIFFSILYFDNSYQ